MAPVRWTGSTAPTHGSTRYIKHHPLEVRSVAWIEWGEGVSCSSNLERWSHDGRPTAARPTAACGGADRGSSEPASGLFVAPFYTRFGPTGVAK
jgi:hypothetical protein